MTEKELKQLIQAVVVVVCPTEARSLGIALKTPGVVTGYDTDQGTVTVRWPCDQFRDYLPHGEDKFVFAKEQS